jgi:hypothetical protein
VEQERATVAQHLAHMRQNVLLEAVKQRIHPRLAQDFGERLDLLARAGRLAVERSALLDAASARVTPRSAPESQAAPAFAA